MTKFKVGDEVSAWVRCLPAKQRAGSDTHERATVIEVVEETVSGCTIPAYKLESYFGNVYDRLFHDNGLKLLEDMPKYRLLQPIRENSQSDGPIWVEAGTIWTPVSEAPEGLKFELRLWDLVTWVPRSDVEKV